MSRISSMIGACRLGWHDLRDILSPVEMGHEEVSIWTLKRTFTKTKEIKSHRRSDYQLLSCSLCIKKNLNMIQQHHPISWCAPNIMLFCASPELWCRISGRIFLRTRNATKLLHPMQIIWMPLLDGHNLSSLPNATICKDFSCQENHSLPPSSRN